MQGYDLFDYQDLLSVLSGLKAKFLLSSYINCEDNIDCKWNVFYKKTVAHSCKNDKKNRVEMLVSNYENKDTQICLINRQQKRL